MVSTSESESVDSASLSSLNIITDMTSSYKSQFECSDNLFVNGALQPKFQQDYVEHDEHEFNDNSTDKDQNDKKLNSQQFIDKSCGHIE